jgi:hypothetical protein
MQDQKRSHFPIQFATGSELNPGSDMQVDARSGHPFKSLITICLFRFIPDQQLVFCLH